MRIIRFTAPWCQPCKHLAKLMESIQLSTPVEVVDIDEKPEIATEFGIRTIPTLVMLDGNTEVKRTTGLMSQTELQEWVNG